MNAKSMFARQRLERLDTWRDAELDATLDTGLLAVLARDRRPFFGDIATEQVPVCREAARDAQRRVAGERPDLDRVARADELSEQGHERALLRRDLHHRDPAECGGLLDQRTLHVVRRGAVCDEVRGSSVRKNDFGMGAT
jgi:hypothetical protein